MVSPSGRRASHGRAERPPAPGILNDDLLTERARHVVGDDASGDIGLPPGAEWNDRRSGASRIGYAIARRGAPRKRRHRLPGAETCGVDAHGVSPRLERQCRSPDAFFVRIRRRWLRRSALKPTGSSARLRAGRRESGYITFAGGNERSAQDLAVSGTDWLAALAIRRRGATVISAAKEASSAPKKTEPGNSAISKIVPHP